MTTPATAILGIDLGTTEVKAGLVGLDGRLLAIARAGYGLDVSGGSGRAEQDPGAWWAATVVAVRALRPPEPVDVVAIGVDGHGPTLAAVDDKAESTRPAITFLDTRATAEADELAAATGIRGWALGPLPAALWVERHEPEVAARSRWYLTTRSPTRRSLQVRPASPRTGGPRRPRWVRSWAGSRPTRPGRSGCVPGSPWRVGRTTRSRATSGRA
jgi:xylulokinase